MFRFFFLTFLFIHFLSYSQDLPDFYYFSDNNLELLRGGVDLDNELYSESDIDTIFLYFDQENYWDELHENFCDKINLSATMIYKNQTFNEVGVRFKGQTSYANTNGENGGGPGGGGPGGGGPGGNSVDTDKKSFNIELDWMYNQDIDGYETLNLNNCYQDPSFLKEFIFEKISRNYIPAVKVNFIQLMINNQNWGLYPNVQQLDKKHASEWFFDDECTRWRAEDPNGSAPGCGEPGQGGGPGQGGPNFGAGTSSLNFLGVDTLNYIDHYTLKKTYKDDPWIDLVNAAQVVDQVGEIETDSIYNILNQYLDLDATLWHLANEIICSDDDSYIHKGGMDYYIYYDAYNGRILPIEYDGNSVFGNQNTNWSPFYHEDDPDFVLLNKLLSIPELRERYLAHFRVILNNSFNTENINFLIDQYAAMIGPYVLDDPQKIYTYDDFLNSVNQLKDYFVDRSSYLLSNDEVSSSGVDIVNVEYYVGNALFELPSSSEEVLISVEVDSNSPVDVQLYYGNGLTGHFEKVLMYYSFATNRYSYSIPPQNSGEYVRFYIETIDENGSRTYSPEGAEHNIYIYQVKMDDVSYLNSDIVINELMAANDFTVADEFGEFDDWIEVYNKGTEVINLEGLHLSDDILILDKYTFPNIVLEPDSYRIIWADDDEEDQGDAHATFKLSASGEQVYLSDSDGNILDEVIFGEQQVDMGYARSPNGIGDFIIQQPTFFLNNDFSSSFIEFGNSDKKLIKTVDLLGRKGGNRGFLIDVFDDGSFVKKYIIL